MTKNEFVEQLGKERDMAFEKVNMLKAEIAQKQKELEYWEN